MFKHGNPVGLVVLGIFASLSVFGQGLHFLPGANHFASQSSSCDHCHHHGAEPASDSDATLDHDCPICRFLAQAQSPADFCIDLPLTHCFELLDDRQTSRLSLPLVALHLARAPPLAA